MYNDLLISDYFAPSPLFLMETFINKKLTFVYFSLFYKILYYRVYIIYIIYIIIIINKINAKTNINTRLLFIRIILNALKHKTLKLKNKNKKNLFFLTFHGKSGCSS